MRSVFVLYLVVIATGIAFYTAIGIVNLLCIARAELVPPIKPPVEDQARDRISALISNCRSRFMEVDQALLDWLSRSAGKRPQLISLLKGDDDG